MKMVYSFVIGSMSRVARTVAVGTLALVLVSAAGARTGGTLGNFCGAVEGAAGSAGTAGRATWPDSNGGRRSRVGEIYSRIQLLARLEL